MKLLYELDRESNAALGLAKAERVLYCVPCDLDFDNDKKSAIYKFNPEIYMVVTNKRFIVLKEKKVAAEYELSKYKKVKCEHMVHSGIIYITDYEDTDTCIGRFTMKNIIRVSYVARGAQGVIEALKEGRDISDEDMVVSTEYEKYCDKCGRALPGTSRCMYCEGKAGNMKKFFALCHDYVFKLILISLSMLVITGLNLLNPIIQRYYIDDVLTSGRGTMTDVWVFIGITLGIMLLIVALGIFKSWNCTKLGASLSMSLRKKLYYKIQALSLSYINTRKPGELMNRVSKDTSKIRNFMEEVFGQMVSTLLTMVVSLVMMFTINAKMTLVVLGFNVVGILLGKFFWHRIHVIFRIQWLKVDALYSGLEDALGGMRVVKAFGKEKDIQEKFEALNEDFTDRSIKNEKFFATLFPLLNFLIGAGMYFAILIGGKDVLAGSMTIGTMLQFITYCTYSFGPLGWMTHLPRAFMEMVTSLNRIYDVLDEESELKNTEVSKEIDIKGAFEFNNVHFGYETYEPVLENVTFDVKPGEMIGLVGPSGAGKSTLINLIMRLYDVNQGYIKIDGVNIKDISIESLHSQIGVVLQETFLFSGSIIDNIRFAKPDATYGEVIAAAKAANAHDFICKTPDGYNTYVGEHGYNLSGGERQRISIARAILNDPKLLILDEATSALDTESEFLIQQALGRLIKGRTTFAIAHRLSTLREADRLVVIDRHGVAEIGTHNELLEQKGIYYGLVTAQLKMAEVK